MVLLGGDCKLWSRKHQTIDILKYFRFECLRGGGLFRLSEHHSSSQSSPSVVVVAVAYVVKMYSLVVVQVNMNCNSFNVSLV